MAFTYRWDIFNYLISAYRGGTTWMAVTPVFFMAHIGICIHFLLAGSNVILPSLLVNKHYDG